MERPPKYSDNCLYCGKPIKQPFRGRGKKFCSSICRNQWWQGHTQAIHRDPEEFIEISCAYCGKTFKAYKNKHRKYCSHRCYIHAMFYKDEDLQQLLGDLKEGKPVKKMPEWIRELLQ
jgi:endogenous inhibitor of DNA gyrase (YacG/DUF329 family)